MQKRLKMAFFGRIILTAIVLGYFPSGCSQSTQRHHPELPIFKHSVEKMLVLVPEIGIFDQLPDGSRIYQEIQSREARRIAQESIAGQLSKRHFRVQTAGAEMMQSNEIQSITHLFRSVNRSIQLHTYGPQIYPPKMKAFDYQVGEITDLLEANHADALVVAIGHQSGSQLPSRNWLSIAVVEPRGHIIWYGVQGNHHRFNLQDPNSVTELVDCTMADFWESGT